MVSLPLFSCCPQPAPLGAPKVERSRDAAADETAGDEEEATAFAREDCALSKAAVFAGELDAPASSGPATARTTMTWCCCAGQQEQTHAWFVAPWTYFVPESIVSGVPVPWHPSEEEADFGRQASCAAPARSFVAQRRDDDLEVNLNSKALRITGASLSAVVFCTSKAPQLVASTARMSITFLSDTLLLARYSRGRVQSLLEVALEEASCWTVVDRGQVRASVLSELETAHVVADTLS